MEKLWDKIVLGSIKITYLWSVDCSRYKPEELDVKVEGNTIIITAKQEIKESGGTRYEPDTRQQLFLEWANPGIFFTYFRFYVQKITLVGIKLGLLE